MFVWDEAKRLSNIRKHGFDFRDAEKIFDGPLVTAEDTREHYGESRFVALGTLEEFVVSVAYAERGEKLRIISIRKAMKHEASYFFSQVSN